jgi:hypothetical protein
VSAGHASAGHPLKRLKMVLFFCFLGEKMSRDGNPMESWNVLTILGPKLFCLDSEKNQDVPDSNDAVIQKTIEMRSSV